LRAVEHVIGRERDHVRARAPGPFHDEADPSAFTRKPVGLRLARVDRGHRRAVHDRVGLDRPDRSEHGVAVADVERGVVEADDFVRRQCFDDFAADHAARAVTRTRNAQVTSRGSLVDRGPLQQRLPPVAIRRVPLDGLAQPGFEADQRFPAELGPDLRRVEQVTPIVARRSGTMVLSESGLPSAERTASAISSMLRSSPVRRGTSRRPSVVEDARDRAAVVVGVDPLALVLGRRVQGDRFVVDGARDEQRYHFFRELVRPVLLAQFVIVIGRSNVS